jgi:Ca2+/Na+ antiporter
MLLGLSENLGGITLLAFGNGAPDIFTSLLNSGDDTELMYTQLMGGATYVTGFIIGYIFIIRPFRLPRSNYIRDVIFFICAVLFIHDSMHDSIYAIYEGVITLGIYFAYLFYVIVEHLLMKRKVKELRNSSRRSSSTSQSEALMKLAEELESATMIQIRNPRNSSVVLTNQIMKVFQKDFQGDPNDNLLGKFLEDIDPIKIDKWSEYSCIKKIFKILTVCLAL